MEQQVNSIHQDSNASGRLRSQLEEHELRIIETTGQKDQTERSTQRQDGIEPPVKLMAAKTDEAVDLAARKWGRFNDVMLAHTVQLQAEASHSQRWGVIFRVSIIILSALVTVITALAGANQRYIATIVGGALTTLAGVESYLQFNRRESEASRQQREVEALRYKLRHQWVATVQMEIDAQQRLPAAIRFLQEGEEAYNVILNNFALKRDGKNAPPQ